MVGTIVSIVFQIAHLVFAAIWAGSVFYVALVVLPLARDGSFNSTKPLEVISGRLTTISRVSALVLFVTGGHMAGTGYTIGGNGGPDLFYSPNGQLVLLMVVLWLVMAALVEVGAKRFEAGLTGKKLREPARNALPLFRAAAAVGVALFVVAGLISSGAAVIYL